MAYKTRATRRESGGYDFSFGAKSKKLIAVAELVEGKWRITDGFMCEGALPFKKLGDLKAAWGALAEISYGQSPPPPAQGPPSIRKGPPSITPKPKAPVYDGPTCPDCKRPVTGWFDDLPPCRCDMANDVDYTPDPFDRNMYTSVGGEIQPTAYGVLDMVYYWMLRNPEYVQTEGVMDSPWKEVQELLRRTLGYAEYRPERFTALAELRDSIAAAERVLDKLGGSAGDGDGDAGDGESVAD